MWDLCPKVLMFVVCLSRLSAENKNSWRHFAFAPRHLFGHLHFGRGIKGDRATTNNHTQQPPSIIASGAGDSHRDVTATVILLLPTTWQLYEQMAAPANRILKSRHIWQIMGKSRIDLRVFQNSADWNKYRRWRLSDKQTVGHIIYWMNAVTLLHSSPEQEKRWKWWGKAAQISCSKSGHYLK